MVVTIDVADIKSKLIENLKPSGWAGKLRAFINSSEFDQILDELVMRREKGERFTPILKQAFRAFEECPYDQLKMVIVGQDPYPSISVADGIAFSCSNTKVLQPDLKNMLQSVHKTVYPGGNYHYDPDLKRWANQGVLLLNTALTTQVGLAGKHYDIWKPFTGFVIDILNATHQRLIWVFMGKVAQSWNELISQDHYIVNVSHPGPGQNRNEAWDCKDIFQLCNDTLIRNNRSPVIW